MSDLHSDLNRRIGDRVRTLRAEHGFSLDALAAKSGVSRSMLSLIERAESSPTAVVLEKLAAGLGVTLSSLFETSKDGDEKRAGPVARRADQPQWKDPGSGYVRRDISPRGVPQPMHIVDVHFPPGARVAFETGIREQRVCQQIWMLEGVMEIAFGDERYRLEKGDCLAMSLDRPTTFFNPGSKPARYAVILANDTLVRR